MDSKNKKNGGTLDLLNTVSNYLANIKKFVYHILFSFLFFQGSKVTYSNPSFSACFQRDFHSHFHLFQTLLWENIVWILRNIYFLYCKKFFGGIWGLAHFHDHYKTSCAQERGRRTKKAKNGKNYPRKSSRQEKLEATSIQPK